MLATLAAEIAGISISLELVSGVSYRIWAPVGALFVWLLLRSAAFPKIEKAISLFGLVTIVFVVAALVLRPPWREVAAGLIPSSPALGRAEYWFLAVALIGSSLSPCMLFFYSAGAREEKWDNSQLRANRLVAGLGMGFGTLMSIAAIVAAGVAYPRGTEIEDYTELPEVLEVPFGERWGQRLFALALLAGSLGVSALREYAPGFIGNAVAAYTLSIAVSLVGVFLFLVSCYYVLTNEDLTVREVLPGSILAAFVLEATFQVLPFYQRYADLNPGLRAFGAPAILLVWLYVMSNVIVFGAELNWWRSRRREQALVEELPGLA
jgi:hypothetical protein